MRRLFLAVLIVTMAAAGGCIKPRPKAAPQAPSALDVPPAPTRVIAPPEPEQPSEETTPDEPAPTKEKPRGGSHPRTQPPRDRADAAKPPETKPETPPVEPVKPPVAAPPAAPLQPALQASTQELTRQVEAQLAQARKDLDKVYYQGLNADAKTQYDTAKQFITQAGAALKEGNLVFAQKLAEKAVGLASNLVPR